MKLKKTKQTKLKYPTNWEKEQANKDFVERKFDIKLGDWVRISIGKTVFDKGYVSNYTNKVYRVVEVERQNL